MGACGLMDGSYVGVAVCVGVCVDVAVAVAVAVAIAVADGSGVLVAGLVVLLGVAVKSTKA